MWLEIRLQSEKGINMYNLTKRYLSILFAVMLVCLIFTGCKSQNKEEAEKNTEQKQDNINIEQKIIFLSQNVNYSDTYRNDGFYINNNGEKIVFDLSDADKKYSDINELLVYLTENDDVKSEEKITPEELKKLYMLLYLIDRNAQINEYSYGADQGSKSLYGILERKGDYIPVLLKEEGDWERTNTDKNAQEIVKYLKTKKIF